VWARKASAPWVDIASETAANGIASNRAGLAGTIGATAEEVPTMTPASSIPSVRELIAEYASIEDRIRSVEARVHGGSAPPVNPELVQLAERERQVLALLRCHHPAE
jgi:hypothetical protein